MIYGSVCSGIEAASVAWEPLGWEPAWLSEIDPFCSSLLAHRYPRVRNLGDMKGITTDAGAIDLLVGGTPCQSFSVAGLRAGLDDPRGNLALVYLGLVDRFRPSWFVWENVPGVLSVDGGRTFGTLLRSMAELGYGWAYRVLDAQYVRVDGYGRAVPQRRRRVFVVGHSGGWRGPGAVLLEPASLRGDSPPRREAGKGVARSLTSSTGGVSKWAKGTGGPAGDECQNLVPAVYPTLDANYERKWGSNQWIDRGNAIAFPPVSNTLTARMDRNGASNADRQAICFQPRIARCGRGQPDDIAPALNGTETGLHADSQPHVAGAFGVRRLTPRECERLQGFPDDWTLVPYRGKPAADGPRYRAIGNSMAVNVMRWIGRRIEMFEAIKEAA